MQQAQRKGQSGSWALGWAPPGPALALPSCEEACEETLPALLNNLPRKEEINLRAHREEMSPKSCLVEEPLGAPGLGLRVSRCLFPTDLSWPWQRNFGWGFEQLNQE